MAMVFNPIEVRPTITGAGGTTAANALALKAMGNLTDTLTGNTEADFRRRENNRLNEQNAIQNAFKQKAEDRAASDWETKQKQAEALRVASLDPTTSTDLLASQGTSKGGELIDLNQRISDAYERDPEAFNKQYGDDTKGGTAAGKILQQQVVDTGSRDNLMTDPKDYMRRFVDNAVAQGADPTQAIEQAAAMTSMADVPTTKGSKGAKASYDVSKDLVSARQSNLDKVYGKNSKTGKSSNKSYSNSAKGYANVVTDLKAKFPNTDWGKTAIGGEDITATIKKYADSGKFHPDDVYAAMILNSSGENDSWASKDAEVQVAGMKETLTKLAVARGKGGGSKGAQHALDAKYMNDSKALQAELAKSGTSYINAIGGTSAGPTTRQKSDKIIADFFSTGKAPKDKKPITGSTPANTGNGGASSGITAPTAEQNKVITKEVTNVVSAIEDKIKDSPSTDDVFKRTMDSALKDFKKVKADKTLSPVEQGSKLLALRLKYGATAAGGFISDALVGLDNLGTAAGNLFRPANAPKDNMTIKEGRKQFADIGANVGTTFDNLKQFNKDVTFRPADYARKNTPAGASILEQRTASNFDNSRQDFVAQQEANKISNLQQQVKDANSYYSERDMFTLLRRDPSNTRYSDFELKELIANTANK